MMAVLDLHNINMKHHSLLSRFCSSLSLSSDTSALLTVSCRVMAGFLFLGLGLGATLADTVGTVHCLSLGKFMGGGGGSEGAQGGGGGGQILTALLTLLL